MGVVHTDTAAPYNAQNVEGTGSVAAQSTAGSQTATGTTAAAGPTTKSAAGKVEIGRMAWIALVSVLCYTWW
jgi:hypothetical protein